VELPTIYKLITKKENGKERTIEEKSSISHLIKLLDWLTKSGCVDTGTVAILYAITGWSSNYTLKHYVIHMAYSVSQPRLRIQK